MQGTAPGWNRNVQLAQPQQIEGLPEMPPSAAIPSSRVNMLILLLLSGPCQYQPQICPKNWSSYYVSRSMFHALCVSIIPGEHATSENFVLNHVGLLGILFCPAFSWEPVRYLEISKECVEGRNVTKSSGLVDQYHYQSDSFRKITYFACFSSLHHGMWPAHNWRM